MQKKERERERKKSAPRRVNMVRDKNRSGFSSFPKTSRLIKSLSLTVEEIRISSFVVYICEN